MTTHRLTIGMQLRVGLGALLGVVLALGALAWTQSEGLWEQTRDLHDHPLQVRRALGALEADVLRIHVVLRDASLAQSDAERDALFPGIDEREVDSLRQVAVLRDRYLGPAADVDATERALARWGSTRRETVRLLRRGERAAAVEGLRPTGAMGIEAAALLDTLRKIDAFAAARANAFYDTASARHEALRTRLLAMLGLAIGLTLLVGALLLRAIQRPLELVTRAMHDYAQGRREARCDEDVGNELGDVAREFNRLAAAIDGDTAQRARAAELDAAMLRELDLTTLQRGLLDTLMRVTGSQAAAVYLLEEGGGSYTHAVSVGLGGAARASFSATDHEGELGVALGSTGVTRLADLPDDTRFVCPTTSGDLVPREVLTIPLASGALVPAVISLASVRRYPEEAVRLVDEARAGLSAWIGGVIAKRRILGLVDELSGKNRELEAQARELAAQASELATRTAALAHPTRALEQQTRELDQASRLKTTFLSTMSHELRTPLNSVIALSSVLRRRLEGAIPAQERGYLDVIERNGKHLLALINDILDLARIEAGRDELVVERFSVADLVGELTGMLEVQAREKGIELAARAPDDLPLVTSDRAKCRHIVQNLLANAVKFTSAGRVEVTAEAAAGGTRVTVTDTGIGIAAERLGVIFEEFRQADETTARSYGGTGLGLAIAKRYASMLGATLEVRSTPGEGSTFTLTLPNAAAIDDGAVGRRTSTAPSPLPPAPRVRSAPAPATTRAPTPAPGGPRRILLVEDSEPAVVQMSDVLGGEGYSISVARTGREALVVLATQVPDAVILDLMMPEVDGFAVLRAMRAAEETALVPVLILTAKHLTRDDLRFLRGNNVHQFVQKGDVKLDELLGAVRGMLEPSGPTHAESTPSSRPRPSRSRKPRLLVVEDNPDNRLAVVAMLGDDFDIVEAADGAAGVAAALAAPPDVVLMDISMPVMDGIQALRAMRADERLAHVPVIAFTASVMKGNRAEILAQGFDGYLAKPVDERVLRSAIMGLLDECP